MTLRVVADYTESEGDCCYATGLLVAGPLQPAIEALTLQGTGAIPSSNPARREQSLNGNGQQSIRDYGIAMNIKMRMGGGDLTSITGYRHFDVAQTDMDPDFSGADIFRYNETFRSRFVSQELSYAADVPGTSANILAGAYWSNEKLDMTRQLPWAGQAQAFWDVLLGGLGLPSGSVDASPGLISDEDMGGAARSFALFGHGNISLTDKWSVSTGLRYSVDERSGRFAYRYFRPDATEPFRFLGVQPGPHYDEDTRDRAMTGTLSLQYQPSASTMLYFSYNRGYKAGGVNIDANGAGAVSDNPDETPGALPLSPLYQPETVDAFEWGVKATYLGGRLSTSAAIFYNDISGLQIAQFVGVRTTIINASGAHSLGVETQNRLQLNDWLSLTADVTWLPQAKYTDDGQIDPVLAGARFRFAPRFSANMSARFERPVFETLSLTGYLQYRYRSKEFIDTASTYRQDAVSVVDASLGIELPSAQLKIEAWVENAFDTTYANQALATPLQAGSISGFMAPPRSFGVGLNVDF
ncbi:MAG TPA: hypothetical protein DCG58_06735 [Hyphomonas adhaerens]|uniref:TonB-dependent receptor-like beta-barrel domain-containing protein n=1 Tax=Hyphomonas adhaerens TaxID=81029 RepID=A0A3B9GXX1_9PROT|nr:hypothetical protein [Hyphomonas sp.]HAE26834.1 hypothetical protein [Hyphomonas adhaerens]